MGVSFNNIPSNVRVPLFYAEVDNSQASYFERQNRTLLIGQKLAAGTAVAAAAMLVARTDEAKALFGEGSMLARMYEVYRLNDDFGEVWCIAVADAAAGVAAGGAIGLTGAATEAGTLVVYIAGQAVKVGVASGDAAAAVATALAAAIAAAAALPVTAAVDGVDTGKVNLTCRWKGETGNDIRIVPNYRGTLGGEKTPAGLTVAITAMAGGATNPDLAAAITAMGDEEYDHVVVPFTDTANLDLLQTELGDATGRWAWSRQIYGHVWSARRGTLSALQTFGAARNDQHATVFAVEPDMPTPVWEVAAAAGARSARFLNSEPYRPTQTGELLGVLPAPQGKRFILTEKQTLLSSGIATTFVGGGVVRIERAVTTYQKNAWNQPDPSYLDSEPLFQLAYILRLLRQRITQKYGRHALADDGTRFGAGKAIVTPKVIRAELIAAYGELERDGFVENAKAFAANLIVERDANSPTRVNVLYPPDLVNQLRIFALLAQFRLQYPN